MRAVAGLLCVVPAAYALGPEFCGNCHEIRPLIDNWRTSTHRGIECTECHESSAVRNVARLSAHVKGEVPEQPKIGPEDLAGLVEKCRSCHQQQYAGWNAGPHSATYARIFANRKHNSSWGIVQAGMEDQPAIPCMTCHSIHRFGEPLKKSLERAGMRQSKVRPSLAFYDRRSRMHIGATLLPVPAVFDGTRPVKMSPDERQGLCYQCHAALASGAAFSGDDRTPVGVHEGLSCFACHQGHHQNTRASCAACHPRLSNCGIDVEKMDTTFRDLESRRNIHTVKCIDCHPSGVPRRREGGQFRSVNND